MAITATFAADFTDFTRGVQQAEASLGTLQTGAGKIPPALQQITSTSTSTSNALGGLHTSLNSVDRTLASLGVNIGPQVRALQELASASGKTATDLGLVATAGLTVAAGLGGWQLGRLIADIFNLDETIANVTAKMMGWGDMAAQTAAVQADILAKASAEVGREITSLSEALTINAAATKRFATEVTQAAAAEKQLAEDTAKWRKENSEDFEARLKKHNEDYRKSIADKAKDDTAYRAFRNVLGEQEIADEEAHIKWQEKQDAAYRKLKNDLAVQEIEEAKTMWDSVKGESTASLQATADKAKETYDYLLARSDEFAPHVIEKYRLIAEAAAVTAANIMGTLGAALAGLTIIGQTPGGPIVSGGPGSLNQSGNYIPLENLWQPPPGLAAGGPVTAGQSYIVGEKGPELYTPGSSGFITPNGGGGGRVTVPITINGSVLSNPYEIARVVGAAVESSLRAAGIRMPSGV